MAEKPTHIVIRGGFYRRFGGKLQSLPVGTEISLSDQAAHRLVKNGTVKAIDRKPHLKMPEPEVIEMDEPKEDEPEPEPKKEKPKKKKKKKKAKE